MIEMYKYLLKTVEFGKLQPGGLFKGPILVFEGRSAKHAIMNNQRVNTEDIFRQIKAIKEVVSCHVMCYRPCSLDQVLITQA
jgi:hypothetical protein